MDFKISELIELIQITENLMLEYGIPIRDTWKGFEGFNYDDFYSNGNSYGKKKLIKITVKENGFAGIKAKKYHIPNFNNIAYDSYEICVPQRLVGFNHPIIHEIVHFLQANTMEEDKNYIEYTGKDILQYLQYLGQRTELEAHFIQLLYIDRYELEKIVSNETIITEFRSKLHKLKNSQFNLILYAKTKGII